MKTIGVLALQGSVEEHMAMLAKLPNVQAVAVHTEADLQRIDGIILPGGESTTMAKLLKTFDLMDILKERIQRGMPAWGTCAGMILLAKEIVGEEPHLAVMDITVRRNAYGSQSDSFETSAVINEVANEPIPMVFIRAPWIEAVGDPARVLCELDGRIVAARQDHMLATSFHPELTEDRSMHRYFADMIRDNG